jgi:PAS domain S-box-containing protein
VESSGNQKGKSKVIFNFDSIKPNVNGYLIELKEKVSQHPDLSTFSTLDPNFHHDHPYYLYIEKLDQSLMKDISLNDLIFLFLVICMILMITYIAETQFRLNSSEIIQRTEKLHNLEQSLNEHSLVTRTCPDGKIIYVNEKFSEVTGYQRHEVIGQSHKMLNSGHHPREFFTQMWDTIKSGKKWRDHIKNKKKNGEYYWVDTSITPIKDEDGNIKEYIAVRNLTTEQKELQEMSQRLQIMAKIGGWTVDVESFTSKWTDQTYRIHGLEPGDAVPIRESINYYAPHERDRISQYVEDAIQHGLSFDDEFEFINQQKENIWVRAMGEPIFDNQKNVVSLIGCFQDITEIKEKEMALKLARIRAEKSEKIKSDFLANMSHEIRTPMNGVIGMVDLLYDTDLNADQKEMLNTIKVSGESLLTILNDILDFSKIESGKVQIENIQFNLKNCISDALSLTSFKATEKKIDLRLVYDPSFKQLFYGDATRINQIFVNLLSNAIKFTNEGEVVVSVDQKLISKDQYAMSITVKDTGIGIPEKAQKNLFQAFEQADNSTTRKYGGTGLGLSISQQLATLMQGQISFTSQEGQGSEFTLTIPLKLSHQNLVKNKVEKQASAMIQIPNHKILVVEDNQVNQKIVQMMLKKMGYQCEVAENGLEAIQCLKQKNYDLIFMDMQMPEMDGITATKEIIKIHGKKAPPIIAMTANVFEEDKKKCFAAGMKDFVAKPIVKLTLEKILTKYLIEEKKSA